MSHKTRLFLCAAALLYLFADFFLFNGPLNRAIQVFSPESPRSLEKDRKKGVVARVHGQAITRSQLDRAVIEHLWLQGKTLETSSPDEQKSTRQAALEDLIDHELLRGEIAASKTKIQIPDAEIDERLKRFAGRFETLAHLESAMKSQGVPSEKSLRDRLAARIQEEKFIESRIAAAVAVTDDEVKKWFEENQSAIALPERIEARHIFIATLETPAEQAKQTLDQALAALTAKQKDFATLAREISEDEANKTSGGYLGWMTRKRLPADFAEPAFALAVSQPTLIRTKLGWHLIEVTARKPAEPRTFDSAKPEIISALEAIKRRGAINAYRGNLRERSSVRFIDTP